MFDGRISQPRGHNFRSQPRWSISDGGDKIKAFSGMGSQVNEGNAIIGQCVLLLSDWVLLAAP